MSSRESNLFLPCPPVASTVKRKREEVSRPEKVVVREWVVFRPERVTVRRMGYGGLRQNSVSELDGHSADIISVEDSVSDQR